MQAPLESQDRAAQLRRFEDLLIALRQLAGSDGNPTAQAQADGAIAIHLVWQEVVVDLVYDAQVQPDGLGIFVALGELHAGPHPPLQLALALLRANFHVCGRYAPRFSCHPDSELALLCFTLPLLDGDAHELVQVLRESVALAHEWRLSGLVTAPGDVPARPSPFISR